MYQVFYNFQRANRGPTRLKEQVQPNKPGFCPLTRPQNMKNQYQGSKDQ